MIDIDSAIIESKNKENISNGGSACYDFGDVVLVKYSLDFIGLKKGKHVREKSEEIMDAINIKNDNGVNTPRHYAVKRVVEGNSDVCYVLQQKCPGINTAKMWEYGVSFDKRCEDLKFVLNIPFEHYKKLISDGIQLYEMGYEKAARNLFYDRETGFWYIDFLTNDKNDIFDENNLIHVYKALKWVIPEPLYMASRMDYNSKLTPEEQKKEKYLENAIKAKTLLAIREVLPSFKKYEKLFLVVENDDYKEYLMKEGIVNTNLMVLEENDYKTFNEIYESIINELIDKVANKEFDFRRIKSTTIENECRLFKLSKIWEMHKENTIKRDEFESRSDYEYEVSNQLYTRILYDLIDRLKELEGNQNVDEFLKEASIKLDLENNKHR